MTLNQVKGPYSRRSIPGLSSSWVPCRWVYQ